MSDASARRYWRLPEGALAVDNGGRGLTNDSHMFLTIATLLQDHGVAAARVVAHSPGAEHMLVCDLGDETMHCLWHQDPESQEELLEQAISTLTAWQRVPPSAWSDIPAWTNDRVNSEMMLSMEFCLPWLDLPGSAARDGAHRLSRHIDQAVQETEAEVARRPMWMHFDYHSKNLIRSGGELHCLDFQDACMGMPWLDVISLTDDLYVEWTPEQRRRIITQMADAYARDHGPVTQGVVTKGCAIASAQRWTRVMGTFCKLVALHNKRTHIPYQPLVIQRLIQALNDHTDEASLAEWLTDVAKPAAIARLRREGISAVLKGR